MKSKLLIVTLVVCLVFGMTGTAFAVTDIGSHWAQGTIERWVDQGLAGGYPDDTFKPNRYINRAEFVTLANSIFEFEESKETDYSDVSEGDWYALELAKANAAGYVSGYEDFTFRPLNKVSRQEAAVMLAKILDLKAPANADAVDRFSDAGSVAAWSKQAINSVVEAGIMSGYPDGSFNPDRAITRAEAVVTLDKAIMSITTVTYSEAGMYGPETGTETINANVVIDTDGLTLQNLIINGDLLLAEDIGDGDVTLKNVTVKGETVIKGGGENSVVLEDCTMPSITVDKEGVRVVASGNTTVKIIKLESGATLVAVTVTGEGFEKVTITQEVPEGSQITLSGEFNRVDVEAKDTRLEVSDGSVKELTLNAKAEVTGKGSIETANINAAGSVIQQRPVNTQVADDVAATVGGERIGPAPAPLPSRSNSGPSKTTVNTISITGNVMVGEKLTATPDPDGASIACQWMKSDAEVGEYVDINDATNNEYTLVSGDAGKYFKAKATGTGNYTGTVTSNPIGPVKFAVSIISITGNAVVGEKLTATPDPGEASITCQWMKSDAADGEYVDINDATNNEYTLVSGDAGKYFKAKATGTGNYTGTVTSNPIGPVKFAVSIISITGNAVVGEKLTATPDPGEASITCQWMKSDAADGEYVDINDATNNEYTLAHDDAGKYIKVKAMGTDNYTGTVTSNAVGPVRFEKATIDSFTANYNLEAPADIQSTVTLNDAELSKVSVSGNDLNEATDYSFNEQTGVLVIKNVYLENELRAFNNSVVITLSFNDGTVNEHTLTLTITATMTLKGFLEIKISETFTLTEDVTLNELTLGADKSIVLDGHTIKINGEIDSQRNIITIEHSPGKVQFQSGFSITGWEPGDTIFVNKNASAEDAAQFTKDDDAELSDIYAWRDSNGNRELFMKAPLVNNQTKDKKYATVQVALAQAASDDVLELIDDITILADDDRIIVEGKIITLDMNGKTITSAIPGAKGSLAEVKAGARLDIVDRSAAKGGHFTRSTSAEDTVFLVNYGIFNMSSIKVTNFFDGVVNEASGTIDIISDVYFDGDGNKSAISNSGTITTISSGKFYSKDYIVLNHGTIETISGGTFGATNYGVLNYGTIDTIHDGFFSGATKAGVQIGNGTDNNARINFIKGGTFMSSLGYPVFIKTDGLFKPEITGGSYKSLSGNTVIYPEENYILPSGYTMVLDGSGYYEVQQL